LRHGLPAIATALFFAMAPGTVAGIIPWWITRWRFAGASPALLPLQIGGGLLAAAGVLVLLDSFRRFVIEGRGTPAPVLPTQHLVVSGLYRYVRNPMYIAVVSTIVGQALLFANVRLLLYGVFVWLICQLFVTGYEEPTLRRTFGQEYDRFYAQVPRWIPKILR
jgi:protein-S-isoprenylcysteine O-methyltransferase Ste14